MNRIEDLPTMDAPVLRDLTTGEWIPIFHPDSFYLRTVLINTAYYEYCGKEYRFLLSEARRAGLDIEKKAA